MKIFKRIFSVIASIAVMAVPVFTMNMANAVTTFEQGPASGNPVSNTGGDNVDIKRKVTEVTDPVTNTFTYTITPDIGYTVKDVKIDGKSIGAVFSYTFSSVKEDHRIAVEFQKQNQRTGDVNGDGEADAGDLTALARHVAKIETITDEELLKNADVNQDGNIDSADLTKLARYVAKIISSLD